MTLRDGKCVPCEGGVPPLGADEVAKLLPELAGWSVREKTALYREFRFRDFAEAMRFVNRMAETAEEEGHHPDFCVHWNRVEVTLTTHAAGGLTRNDFVLAAKISD